VAGLQQEIQNNAKHIDGINKADIAPKSKERYGLQALFDLEKSLLEITRISAEKKTLLDSQKSWRASNKNNVTAATIDEITKKEEGFNSAVTKYDDDIAAQFTQIKGMQAHKEEQEKEIANAAKRAAKRMDENKQAEQKRIAAETKIKEQQEAVRQSREREKKEAEEKKAAFQAAKLQKKGKISATQLTSSSSFRRRSYFFGCRMLWSSPSMSLNALPRFGRKVRVFMSFTSISPMRQLVELRISRQRSSS
jgi:hypothetical protein